MSREPAPPALPPETRTVGQLVAEAVRLYGRRFWASLALGVGPAAVGLALQALSTRADVLFLVTGGAVLLTASYAGAALIASDAPFEARPALVALAGGVLVFLPFPFLASVLWLPGLAWLAFVGLVVPVAIVERTGLRASLRRAVALARADYVHALGALATLTIVAFLTATVLFFLLHGQGDAALAVAAFLALLVISPVVFLGAALLYFDQAARVVRSQRPRRRRSRNADVHPPDDADGPGRPDAQGEPGPAARGQSRRRGARR